MSLAELVIISVTVEGRTKSEVARDYKISRYWVQQLVHRYELEGDASAAAGFAGVDGSVVGERLAGDAVATEGAPEVGEDIGAGGGGSGFAAQCEAGVVVEEVVDLHPSAVGELPVGGVACQRSFGRSASNRVLVLLGRLRGCGVTKPRRVKTRQIVETAGARSAPWRVR